MSKQEQVSWVSLVVSLVIGIWYFKHFFGMPPETPQFGLGTAFFVVNLIIIAIFIGIAGEVLLRWAQRRSGGVPADKTPLDERDRFIDLRASRVAYRVLSGLVMALMAQILITETPRLSGARGPVIPPRTVLEVIWQGPLSPLLIAQLLLLAMTAAGVSIYVTRIVCYRRGY
jgi:hypothetical protein